MSDSVSDLGSGFQQSLASKAQPSCDRPLAKLDERLDQIANLVQSNSMMTFSGVRLCGFGGHTAGPDAGFGIAKKTAVFVAARTPAFRLIAGAISEYRPLFPQRRDQGHANHFCNRQASGR